ncbi:MAG: SPOR domain-containing protein [Pseudomonadota bacterium]
MTKLVNTIAKTSAAAAFAVLIFGAAFTTTSAVTSTPAEAASSCGWFAFAGAYKSRSTAQRRANRLGGFAWSVDASNSPNAGQGWWAVGTGPGTRSQANRWKRQYQNRGASSYVANRCFYGE